LQIVAVGSNTQKTNALTLPAVILPKE
jgi:hypothetical protein